MSEESPDRRSRSKLAPKIPDDEVARPSGNDAAANLESAKQVNGHASSHDLNAPAATPSHPSQPSHPGSGSHGRAEPDRSGAEGETRPVLRGATTLIGHGLGPPPPGLTGSRGTPPAMHVAAPAASPSGSVPAASPSQPATTPVGGTGSLPPMRALLPSTPPVGTQVLADSHKLMAARSSTVPMPLSIPPNQPVVLAPVGPMVPSSPSPSASAMAAAAKTLELASPDAASAPNLPVAAPVHATHPGADIPPPPAEIMAAAAAMVIGPPPNTQAAPPTDPEVVPNSEGPPSSQEIPIAVETEGVDGVDVVASDGGPPPTERNLDALSQLPRDPEGGGDAEVSVDVDIGTFGGSSFPPDAPTTLNDSNSKHKVPPPPPPPRASSPQLFERGREGAPLLAPLSFTEAPTVAKKKSKPWWEELFNDDFLRTMEKLTDAQIDTEVNFIEESLSVTRDAMILDLACGPGRHAIALASRGYQVVGLDLSLSMLAKASEDAMERERPINFVHGDMRDLTFEETFDGIYCWNTSFGFFDEEKNAQVIARVHRALKKGGQFLLDVVNRDYLLARSPSLVWFEGEGCICMDEMHIDWITSRMKVKRTMMIEDGRTREIEYSVRLYTLHELGRILHEHGFRVAEVSGQAATPGVFFGADSPRTIILAEKR